MFAGLKKRLTTATTSSGSASSSSSTAGGAGGGNGSSSRCSSETNTKKQQPIGSSFRRTLRKSSNSKESAAYDVQRLKSKVTHLASFDACVEAADGLAVEEPAPNRGREKEEQGSLALSRRHSPSGLPDPSVLVSVDGNLLFIPPVKDLRTVFRKQPDKDKQNRDETAPRESSDDDDNDNNNDDDDVAPTFSKLMINGKDDYDSAVFLGSDIDGDKKLNGFSAMGWSLPATSHALGQCEAALQNLLAFTESLLLNKKETCARTSQACDALRDFMPSLAGRPPLPIARTHHHNNNNNTSSSGHSLSATSSTSVGDDWEIIDPRANEFVPNTADRTGPLTCPDSSVDRALVVLEEYYSQSAIVEHELARQVSVQKDSVLPRLQEAYQRVSQRVQHRDEALEQASLRARFLEERLQGLRNEAEQKWEKVYKTERKVKSRLESLYQERSRLREKARMDQLQKESEAAAAASSEIQQQSTQDILDLVAQISADGGSFEPMELGIKTPEKKKTNSVVDTIAPDDTAGDSLPMTSPGMAVISREEVEQEFKLPQLRKEALRADEKVEDASQDLLQALSNFDTTRRAARVVAETAMVNACNAQVNCVRELVSLERKSIEQRLELVKKLEERLPEINVRKDLDMYISRDKKDRGGTSHLGDDDDGGIASALAVLSSHADAHHDGEWKSDDELDGPGDISVSREEVLAALNRFFVDRDTAEPPGTDAVEKALELVCRVASSPNSRSQRSTVCYALNSKRSTSASIHTLLQFDGLCKVFSALLTSYVNDESGMANAKMLMMLAQTFYFLDDSSHAAATTETSPARPKREKRIYVRNRLKGHAIWSNEAFWDEAFRTAMAESLTVSGVMSNFERRNQMIHSNSDHRGSRNSMMKWYDLNYEERIGAASQVHAVIFAQLGALAHSMIEFGCGLERSCAFVRRTSIRNQLPSAQRTMLLQHLITRQDAELGESSNHS